MAKPQKWAYMRAKYPALPEDPEHEDVVKAARQLHVGKPLEELAVVLNDLEGRKDALQAQVADLDTEILAVERLMQTEFDTTGVERIRVGGYNFSPSTMPVPKIVNPVEFREWIDTNSPEVLSVNAQTLKGIVSRALEDMRENPASTAVIPAGIEVHQHTTISRRK